MTRFFVGLVFVLAVLCLGIATQASFDAEKQSAPPHVEPAGARVYQDYPNMLDAQAQVAFIEGTISAWIAAEEARLVEEARTVDLRRRVPSPTEVPSGDCAALAAELDVPPAVLWRESRCRTDAYNATGCGGRGCLGAAQLDAGHFYERSPWNPNVPGTCYGLSYSECARKLPSSAW